VRSGVAAAGRIDGRELSRERLPMHRIGSSIISRGAHDTYARPHNDDTSEEQKRFALGDRWHVEKIASPTAE
jgi:hypothetical protein